MGIQKALLPHHVFEERQLAFVDEQRQFARFGEVGLRGKQGHRLQPFIAVARHRCRGNRQQRAAQAIAGRVHLAVGHDRRHRVERRHDAELQIIVHGQIAVFRFRILPRDHEHREALVDQIAHQRVVRRQVEDVIFHDPGRHDQQRFGVDRFGYRLILDQFHQPVAIDNLALCHRHVAADLKGFRADRLAAADQPLPVLRQVLQAAHQVHAAFFGRLPHQFRIGRQKIRRRQHVEDLARRKLHLVFVLPGDAGHAGHGVVPPLLIEQKALVDDIIGPALPGLAGKAPVLRQRFDARWRRLAAGQAGARIPRQAQPFLDRLLRQLRLLAWRIGKMERPVGKGFRQCRRRQAGCHACDGGMHGPVDRLRQSRGGKGFPLHRQAGQRWWRRRWYGRRLAGGRRDRSRAAVRPDRALRSTAVPARFRQLSGGHSRFSNHACSGVGRRSRNCLTYRCRSWRICAASRSAAWPRLPRRRRQPIRRPPVPPDPATGRGCGAAARA